MKKAAIFAVALASLVIVSVSRSTPSYSIDEIRVDWHLAGFSEAIQDWRGARENFLKVVREAQYLPLPIREWYRGMGWLGISRSSACVNDTLTARQALAEAFAHGFSNALLLGQDSNYTKVVSLRYLDSLRVFWNDIRQANAHDWLPQEPIVFRPKQPDSNGSLIIALHGGNDSYRNFATYWEEVADREHVTVVVPPGIIRNSETENSWEFDIAAIEPSILSLIDDYAHKFDIDPEHVYLAGYSQGAQAAMALALLHPDKIHGAISFAGFFYPTVTDSLLRHAARSGTRMYALSGELDGTEFRSRVQMIGKRCNENGLTFYYEEEKELVHEMPLDFDSQFARAWQWMQGNTSVNPVRASDKPTR